MLFYAADHFSAKESLDDSCAQNGGSLQKSDNMYLNNEFHFIYQ